MEDFGPLFRVKKKKENKKGKTAQALSVSGLFAGIGGIELGFHQAGHTTTMMCEIDPHANRVLAKNFPDVPLHEDVRSLKKLPKTDLLSAGFPCQDLSQAGKTAGIKGQNSGLVGEVFRLLMSRKRAPKWLLLENVPFMLQLDRGRAMSFLTKTLTDLGFNWAYRTIDTRAFGLPQRRRRVILLASKTEDPRGVLFSKDSGARADIPAEHWDDYSCGFYWTEGTRGLGWGVDCVPTLKGGSGIGIPSPPAIWMRSQDNSIVTPDIRDAERLQGFPVNWTNDDSVSRSTRPILRKSTAARWKLVGNAVSVPLAKWVGEQLFNPGEFDEFEFGRKMPSGKWPSAAYSMGKKILCADVSTWPCRKRNRHLAEFLKYDPKLLSERATAGFLKRTNNSSLRFPEGFIDALEQHLIRMQKLTKKKTKQTP